MRGIKFIAVICLFCGNLCAQQVNTVADGQAIFIYNFTKMIAWPESRKMDNFMIGILGEVDVFNAINEYTKQKSVAGRNIMVKYFRKASEINDCHMLMVTSSHMKDLEDIVEKATTENILLISEKVGAIEKGAAINFILVDGKIKYEVKSSNLSRCRLKHVSQLEGLAYKKY